MRKRRLDLVLLACALAASTACTGVGPLGVGGIELSVRTETSLLEAIGQQTQLELEFADGVTPSGLEAVWRTNAPSIASVDANGMVTAVGQGVATISVESGGMSASTVITVDAEIVGVAQVRSDQTDPNPANNSASVTLAVQAN